MVRCYRPIPQKPEPVAREKKVCSYLLISYADLKELLQLPDDVDLLGYGDDINDGCLRLLIETPISHIRTDRLEIRYSEGPSGRVFEGFE